MSNLECAIAQSQCHAQKNLKGQREKKVEEAVTLAVSSVKIDFGFELIQKKKMIDCIVDLYMVNYVFIEIRYIRI